MVRELVEILLNERQWSLQNSGSFRDILRSPPGRPAAAQQEPLVSTIKHRDDPNLVKRQALPYWQSSGWRKDSWTYSGFYRTPYERYPGAIIERPGEETNYYIFSPPACLSYHPHHYCFHREGGTNRYDIHFSKPGQTVDDAILAVEAILTEALERYGGKKRKDR